MLDHVKIILKEFGKVDCETALYLISLWESGFLPSTEHKDLQKKAQPYIKRVGHRIYLNKSKREVLNKVL